MERVQLLRIRFHVTDEIGKVGEDLVSQVRPGEGNVDGARN